MSNSSDFSMDSDMDVEEGTIAAEVLASVQEANPVAASLRSQEEGKQSAVSESPKDLNNSQSQDFLSQENSQNDFDSVQEEEDSNLFQDESRQTFENEQAKTPESDPGEVEFQEVDSSQEIQSAESPVQEESYERTSELEESENLESDLEDSKESDKENSFPYKHHGSVLSFLFEKPKVKHNPHLQERLWKYQTDVQEKIKRLAKERDRKINEECTFYPNIKHSNYRPFFSFWNDQMASEYRKKERLALLTQERDALQKFSYKPKICHRSDQIARESRPHQSVFDTLYRQSESVGSLTECSEHRFVPTINAASQKIKRELGIADHLYKDAQRRQTTERVPFRPMKKKLISKNSEQYLVSRFVYEFNKVFYELAVPKRDIICYSLFIILLQRLHYIKNDITDSSYSEERYLVHQAWDGFNKKVLLYVHKDELLKFLMELSPSSPYALFFKNRQKLGRTSLRQPRTFENFDFCPHISLKSNELANSKRKERGKDFLINEKHKIQEKWKKTRMEREKEEISGLSFRPYTNKMANSKSNKHDPNTKAYLWKDIRDKELGSNHKALGLFLLGLKIRDKGIAEAYRDYAECTFHPNTKKPRMKGVPAGTIKGYNSALYRLKRARTEREEILRKQEKGFTEGMPEKKIFLNTQSKRLKKKDSSFLDSFHPKSEDDIGIPENGSTPEDFEEDSDDGELIISVTLPSGAVEYIVIANETDKAIAVDQFIVKHELTGDIARQLREGVMAS